MRATAVSAAALAGLAAVLLARHPERDRPQLWAEDAAVFCRQSLELGGDALLAPYAGYLHLGPRLLAGAAAPMPAAWLPVAYMLLSLGATVAAAAVLLHPRLPLPAKPLLVLLVGLTPHSGEVSLRLCNVQWYW